MRASILLLGLSACLGESARPLGGLGRSRVLALRGGGVAAAAPSTAAPSTKASGDDAPPAAVQLRIAACAPPHEGGSRVEVGSAAYEALKLKDGMGLRVRKMQKAKFWSSVADQTLGSAVENPDLEEGKVKVYTSDVAELRLKMGDEVLVAPVPAPPSQSAVQPAAPSQTAVEHHHHHHHGNGFLHNYLWYRMMMGSGPRFYGGYGDGLGGRRGYQQRRSYRSYRHRSSGMGRRRR